MTKLKFPPGDAMSAKRAGFLSLRADARNIHARADREKHQLFHMLPKPRHGQGSHGLELTQPWIGMIF
jgi:hypothetical protein